MSDRRWTGVGRDRLLLAIDEAHRLLRELADRKVMGLHVCCGVACGDPSVPIDEHSPTCPVVAALR